MLHKTDFSRNLASLAINLKTPLTELQMAKLFNTRELFYRYKWLGTLRMNFFVWWCNHGTRFFDRSYRRVRVVSPAARPFIDNVTPAIFAMYHGSMICVLDLHPRKKTTILISGSRDGEMIARAMCAFGFSVARGSSGRGGVKATFELLESAQQGNRLAFMVDGPKGPNHIVKSGVIRVASMTGLPIIPLGLAARGSWYMKSWDSFDASSWSSPMLTIFGDPLYVPANISDEECERLREELNGQMQHLHQQAFDLMSITAN